MGTYSEFIAAPLHVPRKKKSTREVLSSAGENARRKFAYARPKYAAAAAAELSPVTFFIQV